MKRIGLTGGIGSGKSYVAKIFNELFNVPVFSSDKEVKRLMSYDYKLKLALTESFGSEIYNSEGLLNRDFIASKIFNTESPEVSKKMHEIVEPFIFSHFDNWCYAHKAWNPDLLYCLLESAIIFESNLKKRFDATIIVTAPLEVRLKRVKERDPFRSDSEIEAILLKQMPQEEKEKKANFVIINDGIVQLREQVEEIHKKLII